jgi:hypothetical protein
MSVFDEVIDEVIDDDSAECNSKKQIDAVANLNTVRRIMKYTIQSIPQDFLDRVRNRGIDDLGQPVRRFVSANGDEPCRDVLRMARPGEEVILASFSPFAAIGPYREYGPVFVLGNGTSEDVARNVMPRSRQDPDGYVGTHLAIRAYAPHGDILDSAVLESGHAEDQIQTFLSRPEVDFVDARFAGHGCFAFRVKRAE